MFRWSAIFMIIAILAITGFQLYWLKNNYDREKQNLEITTNSAFKQTVLGLQASKLKLDRFNVNFDESVSVTDSTIRNGKLRLRRSGRVSKEPTITMLNILQEQVKDTVFRR